MQSKLLTYFRYSLNAYTALLIYLFSRRNDSVWLIGGLRGELYEDNAKVFYEYLLANQKHLNIYWIARKNSPSFRRAKGKVLEKGSVMSYLMFLHSEVIVFSDTLNEDIAPCSFLLPAFRYFYKRAFKVRLNHGTIAFKKKIRGKGLIGKVKDKILQSYDLSTASTKLEFDVLSGYMRKETVVLTGSARNDNVAAISEQSQTIFVYPTWRTWLMNRKTIENTDFYSNYSQLFSNEALLNVLRKNEVKLEFSVHHMFLKYLHEFAPLENDTVRILDQDADIQSRILQSSLLVTDYSSVCSERYYINKPVLFFQFDREKYLSEVGSYVDLKQDSFGDVGISIEQTVDKITQYVESNYPVLPVQVKGEKYFVHFKDRDNCNRIFNTITETMKTR